MTSVTTPTTTATTGTATTTTATTPAMSLSAAEEARAQTLFDEHHRSVLERTDRMFAYLMLVQWAFAIFLAFFVSPLSWAGKTSSMNAHVPVAILLGGLLTSLPVFLAFTKPGAPITRYVIACAQMLWSALLIHLTGGRLETHFHVFGSLAFLAFYRDWKVLVPATIVVATDHVVRQFLWPESVYGLVAPETWRFLEHAGWVVFEDVILVMSCLRGVEEMRTIARNRVAVESLSLREQEKANALDKALHELKDSQDALVRTEKLAAVGQLAASVGHELRNPLAAVRNAATYLQKRNAANAANAAKANTAPGPDDARVQQCYGVIDRELNACSKIISDLLDFARDRPLTLSPCPLGPLVQEAVSLIPPSTGKVEIVNEIPDDLPVPELDREQFRQILINLVQNAVEAVPADRDGKVVIAAHAGGDAGRLTIAISDNGSGMSPEVVGKIFEPLFTTKTKGTGLGLAVVASIVKRHGGTIQVSSDMGRGTTITLQVPASSTAAKAA